MAFFTNPQSASQHIGLAKALLKRGKLTRGLEALSSGLDLYVPALAKRQAKFEIEILLEECLHELNRQPQVRHFLARHASAGATHVAYTPGEETRLQGMIHSIREKVGQAPSAAAHPHSREGEKRKSRKWELEDQFLRCMQRGDMREGHEVLKMLAHEFGKDGGMLLQIGVWLYEAKQYRESVTFLEQSMNLFPSDRRAYGIASACYLHLKEYEKAEAVYRTALRQFGNNPNLLLHLARLYEIWGRHDSARKALEAVFKLDASNTEARNLLNRLPVHER